ncbi:hypothetical protein F8S13_22455 [Chloroflexia bacterium SDU3-3]|nr:hypothetical protein F8S13_22455 [Chloroflexia bacterium SDU3-3]
MTTPSADYVTRPATAPRLRAPRDHSETLLMLTAELHVQRIAALGTLPRIHQAGLKVFSQHDDDGIIQYLIQRLEVPRSFIEFGVEDYEEANTRFLLLRDGSWRGLLLDGDPANIDYIRYGEVYWRYDLTAVAAFVTRENINDLIAANGFAGEVGILSIDLDGVDYWVWEALTVVDPVIVIVEYNSVFGCDAAITVPYHPQFQRTAAHHSNLYFGASLPALAHLAARKGYALIGSNSAGNNAYFVRRDRLGPLTALTAAEGYIRSVARESIDPSGVPTFLSGDDRLRAIADMPAVDVITSELRLVGAPALDAEDAG